MATLAEDIAAALTTAGYTDLRVFRFDSISVPQICIIVGGGTAYIVSGGDIEKPNVQIQVRDADLATAEARALAIRQLLHKKDNLANAVTVIWDGRAADYWQDENDLHIFSIGFKVIKST
jgi:3-mercaptopyruvate sulfurtransferase SseA